MAKPNKWGWYGYNCKGWESGSGTTHQNRRDQRRHLQWDSLEKEDPNSEECLGKHLELLTKAQEKAQKKLKEAREKSSLEKDDDDDEDSSLSIFDHKKGKKRRSNPKAAASTLEKVEEAEGTFRRSRTAKNGTAEKLHEKPLEKGSKTKSLEKDSQQEVKVEQRAAAAAAKCRMEFLPSL